MYTIISDVFVCILYIFMSISKCNVIILLLISHQSNTKELLFCLVPTEINIIIIYQ